MYATDVKALIEKKKDVKFAVSEGPVSAIAVFRPSEGDDMELLLFNERMFLLFDEIRIADSQGIELYFKNLCVVSIDVTEWREL